MKYILNYFEELIEHQSVESKNNLFQNDLSGEIKKQRGLIQCEMRQAYYNMDGVDSSIALKRIALRIINMSLIIKKEIDYREFDLVTLYITNHNDYTALKNYYSLYKQLIELVQMVKYEFCFDVDFDFELANGEIQEKTKHAIKMDYNVLVKCLKENIDFPEEIVHKYAFIARDVKAVLERKEIILSFEESCVDNVEESELQPDIAFLMNYINPLAQFKPIDISDKVMFNQTVVEFVKAEISKINSIEERKRFIISFYIHTGYCKDVVFKYINSKLNAFSNALSERSLEELKGLYYWFDGINRFKKFHEYSIEKYGYKNSLKDEVRCVLEQFNRENNLEDILTIHIASDNSWGVDKENKAMKSPEILKLVFEKNAAELGIFIDALFESGMFIDTSTKAIAEVFSTIVKTKSRNIGSDHLENKTCGWDKNDSEAEYIIKKLNLMIKHIATKEKKSNKKQ